MDDIVSSLYKKAKTQMNIAIIVFSYSLINIFLKIIGVTKLGYAVTYNGAILERIIYYGFPILLLMIAWFFFSASRVKRHQAEFQEESTRNANK